MHFPFVHHLVKYPMEQTHKTQQLQFLQSLKDAGRLDALLSELQEVPTSSMASMHDGAKRRMFSPSSEEFDLVEHESLGRVPLKSPYQAPVAPKASSAAPRPGEGLPKDLPTVAEWGRTICDLPKYKSKNWCYSEMVSMATSNGQIRSYLGWVTRNGHVSPKVQDFANYLNAIAWVEAEEEEGKAYFPGTCDVRRLK